MSLCCFLTLELPSYQDYFPAFSKKDCILKISQQECNFTCPQYCSQCEFDEEKTMIDCTGCNYGYYLNSDNNCIQCPEDCIDCLLNYDDWSTNFLCSDTGVAYYIDTNNEVFQKCSPNCILCNSFIECLQCSDPSFYLKWNSVNNYSCQNCLIDSNCNTCYYGNITDPVLYEDLLSFKMNVDFLLSVEKYNWTIQCLSCPELLGEINYECVQCSDYIKDCSSCTFRNNSFSEAFCYTCDNNKVVIYDKYDTTCEVCQINNCNICQNAIQISNSWTFLAIVNPLNLYLNNPNFPFVILCYECEIGYGFGDIDQKSCQQCPSYCESCYLSNQTMFCGRCQDNYVLNIFSGICEPLSNYSNITTSDYVNECSKIISENPWRNDTANSSAFLCQECKTVGYSPDISGNCLTNQSGCSTFYEGYLSSPSVFLNMTDVLLTTPLLLENLLLNQSSFDIMKKCLSCPNNADAFDSVNNECCSPGQFLSPNDNYVWGECEKCEICLQNSCLNCGICSDLVSNNFIDDGYISNSNLQSFYYEKKIYWYLINEGTTFDTFPQLNETEKYITLYNEMQSMQGVILNFGNNSACSYCPINSKNCTTQRNLSPYDMTSSYDYINYFTESIGCLDGFVFDSDLKRCKYCPNNWTACDSFKEIRIQFLSRENNLSSTDSFTVFSLEDLGNLLDNLENNDLAYIMNEFAVTSIDIIIEFDTSGPVFLSGDSFNFSFESQLKSKISSLAGFSLFFQPIGYDSNNSLISQIYLGCWMTISGFDILTFRNLEFLLLNYELSSNFNLDSLNDIFDNYGGSCIPGFYFIIEIISLFSCKILQAESMTYELIDLEIVKQVELENQYHFCFFFFVEASNFTIDDMEISFLSRSVDGDLPVYDSIFTMFPVFMVQSTYCNILNVQISDSEVESEDFIVIYESNIIIFQNITLRNVYFPQTSFLYVYSQSCSISINDSLFQNVTIVGQGFFTIDFSNLTGLVFININNQFFENCNFTNALDEETTSHTIYSFPQMNIYNLTFSSCNFTYYYIIFYYGTSSSAIQENYLNISLLLFENNRLEFTDSDEVSFAITIYYPWNSFQIINFENIFLLNNFGSVETLSFIYLNFCNDFSLNNSFLQDNSFSFAEIQNIGLISLENIIFRNSFNSAKNQDQYFLSADNIDLQIIGKNITFENILCTSSLIYAADWHHDDNIRLYNFSWVSVTNISLMAMEVVSSIFNIYSWNNLLVELSNSNFQKTVVTLKLDEYSESSTVFYLTSPFASFNMSNCNVSDNYGNLGSVAIVINSQIIIINNCLGSYLNYFLENNITLLNQKSMNNLGSFGSFRMQNISLMNSSFFQCFAQSGGVFYLINEINPNIFIENTNFNNIYSTSSGGVFYFSITMISTMKFTLSNCIFRNIISLSNGGIICDISSSISHFLMNNCNFSKLYSEGRGSLIMGINTNATLNNCNIYENQILSEDIPEYFKAIQFAQSYGSSNLIDATSSYIVLISCVLSNLRIYGQLLNGISGASNYMSHNNSLFENISFDSIFFTLDEGETYFYYCNFSNVSSFNLNVGPQAFIKNTDSILYLEGCSFQESTCEFCAYSALLYSVSHYLSINKCLFENNVGQRATILSISGFFLNSSDVFYLNDSIVDGNLALKDIGCIQIQDCKTFITGCSFQNNTAVLGYGGVIYFSGLIENQYLNVKNTIFLNNSAYYGGAIYYQDQTIQLINVNFSENQARFGNNLFSYPRNFNLINCLAIKTYIQQLNPEVSSECSETSLQINRFKSGDFLPELNFMLADEENNELNYSGETNQPTMDIVLTNFNNTEAFFINDQKTLRYIQLNNYSVFNLTQYLLIAKPNSTAILLFTSDQIETPNVTNYFVSSIYQFIMTIDMRECYIGEIFISSVGSCDSCPTGTYSYNISDTSCTACLEGLNCTGGNQTIVLPGYWREQVFSDDIIPCDNYAPACVGGNGSGSSLCAYGYIGAMCGACDLTNIYWKVKYARSGKVMCQSCVDASVNVMVILFVSLFTFFYMSLSIKGTLDNLKVSMAWQVVKLISRFSMIPEKVNESAFYIKMYMGYLQIILIITTFDLNLPSWINDSVSVTGDPLDYFSNAIDCYIPYQNGLLLPSLYLQLIINIITPFGYFFVFSMCYVGIVRNMKNFPRKYQLLYSAALFTFLFFMPTTLRKIMKVLTCVTVGDKNYIKDSLVLECYTYDYFLYNFCISLPAVLYWTLFTPLFFLYQLISRRKKLRTLKMQIKYGYLYNEYKLFYWEFVKIYQKIFLIMVVEIFDSESDINIKGLLALVILGTYYLLNNKYQPYKQHFQNQLDKFTSTVCIGSIFWALFIHDQKSVFLETVGYLFIGALNLLYNIFMIKLIANSFLFKMKDRIELFKKKLLGVSRIFILCFWNTQKEFKTIEKWVLVRRLAARYLREKERRKKSGELGEEENLNLSLNDYDPFNVGIQRKNKLKVAKSFTRQKKNILTSVLSPDRKSESFNKTSPESNSRREEAEKENELNSFLQETLKKIRLQDFE